MRIHIMKRILLYSLICSCIIYNTILWGQNIFDAKRLSMAGSSYAIEEGNEYFGGNPATLAQIRSFNFEIHLATAHFMVNNNSYSWSDYNKYFTSGDSLTNEDIDYLMGAIPESGLRGDAILGAKALSFYTRPFSISFGAIGNGYLEVPKEVVEFPFYGNTTVTEYSLDGTEGEAWSAGTIEFAIGFPVTQWSPSQFDFFSVGISARYLVGIEYANIEKATGSIVTTEDYLLANAHIENRRSSGGIGYGIDLGFLGVYEKDWTLSLHFTNLLGSIKWNKDNEKQIIQYLSDSLLSLDNLEDLTVVDEDTTIPIGAFSTGLQRSLTLATAFQYQPNLKFTFAYRQGLNSSLGNITRPLISFGTEYRPASYLPLRGGMAIGGESNFALGLGLGIDLKYWQLNIGYMNHNFHWFRGTRSIDIALSTQFRF